MKNRNSFNDLFDSFIVRILKLVNVILCSVIFGYTWFTFYAWQMQEPFFFWGHWFIIGIFFLLYTWLVRLYGGVAVSYKKKGEMIYSQLLSNFIADFFMYLLIVLLIRSYIVSPVPILLCLGIQVLTGIIWTFIVNWLYFKIEDKKRTAIVWDKREDLLSVIEEHGLDAKFDVIKDLHIDDVIEHFELLDDVDIVFLSGIHSTQRNIIIKYCTLRGITSFIIPRVGDMLMASAHRMHMLHLPVLRLERYNPNPEYLFLKRAFDIIVSLLAIVILSPFMIITALAIKSDGGPALYKQTRLTKDGKEFKVLKFRSMRVDAEKDGVARLSTGENDDRITKVGHVIRAIRFDELPQLFNILKGDMTIVGPRPERPEIAKEYYKTLPEFELRLQAKAGLTGYAQVYGKYNTSPYDKLLMDLMYISNPSVFEDISIMFATVKILFMKDSTEGVAEGATTAADNNIKNHNSDDRR